MYSINFTIEILTLCIMKGISKLSWLTFIVCLMSVLSATAEDRQTTKTESPTKSGEGILYSLEYNTDRKRMPSRDVLELYYDGEILAVESPTLEGMFSLQFSNEENGAMEYIPSVFVGETVCIDLDCGSYLITALSVSGVEYYGYLIVSNV